jgi:hypothetical protein
MNCNDIERKVNIFFLHFLNIYFVYLQNVKKQRTDEQVPTPLFTRNHLLECIDELLTTTDKRSLKRKHRREQQRSAINTGLINKKENKRSNTTINKTYDRYENFLSYHYF